MSIHIALILLEQVKHSIQQTDFVQG